MATKCGGCARSYVVVDLDIGGETVRMQSCSYCDRREWVGTDGSLDLAGVLDTVQARVGR